MQISDILTVDKSLLFINDVVGLQRSKKAHNYKIYNGLVEVFLIPLKVGLSTKRKTLKVNK